MNEVSLCDRYLSYILFFPIAFGVVSPCFALDLEAGLWNHIPLGSPYRRQRTRPQQDQQLPEELEFRACL